MLHVEKIAGNSVDLSIYVNGHMSSSDKHSLQAAPFPYTTGISSFRLNVHSPMIAMCGATRKSGHVWIELWGQENLANSSHTDPFVLENAITLAPQFWVQGRQFQAYRGLRQQPKWQGQILAP